MPATPTMSARWRSRSRSAINATADVANDGSYSTSFGCSCSKLGSLFWRHVGECGVLTALEDAEYRR